MITGATFPIHLFLLIAVVEPSANSFSALENRLGNDVSGWSAATLARWEIGLLVLTLILVGVAAIVIFRMIQSRGLGFPSAADSNLSLRRLALKAFLIPALVFAAIWGVHAVVFPLVQKYHTDNYTSAVLSALLWLRKTLLFITILWFIFRAIAVAEIWLKRYTEKTLRKWDDILAVIAIRAARLILPLIAILGIIPTLNIPESYHAILKQCLGLLVIGAVGFILYQLTETGEAAILERFRLDTKENLLMRKVQTQVRVLKRIVVVMIFMFTVAMMLMEFESVRHLGASLMASAGVAGVVIGFAAQRSIATLVAGIQIAFTQPIRLDDVVIVEGEWGRIEEITMTYVVVLIWDQRRMILPITYFIEKPFQNWTRINADLLGTVFLYVDFTAPVDALRAELEHILAASRLWDQRVKNLQVTDYRERVMEIRILASAADASKAFDLRCEIREKMILFLQKNYPEALPQTRVSGSLSAENPALPAPRFQPEISH